MSICVQQVGEGSEHFRVDPWDPLGRCYSAGNSRISLPAVLLFGIGKENNESNMNRSAKRKSLMEVRTE